MKSDFLKAFKRLCVKKDQWGAWNDFIFCSSAAISNALEVNPVVRDAREHEYMRIVSGMDKDELDAMAYMVAAMANELERNQEQDFLGCIFMELGLGSHWKGQFFTPYCLCKMMSEMTCRDAVEAAQKHGWCAVNDPACGAGATLIAARNTMQAKGLGPGNVLFVAQDISRIAALMCYIQLSLLGCAGYVVIADSLLHPLAGNTLNPVFTEKHEVWYTPVWYEDVWECRRILERMKKGG